MSAIGGFSLPTPWQQMQTMDATFSNALSGNTNSNSTLVSMLSGGATSGAADTMDAVSSAMASVETSSFQGYAQLAAQAALKRVQNEAKAAQAQSSAATDASAPPAASSAPDVPDPLNPFGPANPLAAQQDVTLGDGTVIKAPTGVDLGNGAKLDPSTGITTMADGTQINSYGVPVKEMNTLPLDLPPGFNVDVTA